MSKLVDKPLTLSRTGKPLLFCYHFHITKEKGGGRMVQTTIRLPKELHTRLRKLAKSRGMTLNGFIVSVLWKTQI